MPLDELARLYVLQAARGGHARPRTTDRLIQEVDMQVTIFGREPAVWVYVINSLVAVVVAYGLPLSQVQVATISTLATVVLAAIVAVLTRPFIVSALTGAVATGLTAMAGFGLMLSANQIGATVTAMSIGLALVLRANVSPAPATSSYPPGSHA